MNIVTAALTAAVILVSIWFMIGITREWLLMRQHRQQRRRVGVGKSDDHDPDPYPKASNRRIQIQEEEK